MTTGARTTVDGEDTYAGAGGPRGYKKRLRRGADWIAVRGPHAHPRRRPSSIQLILSKRPTFNGLCAIHALITHSDSRLCAPEYGLVIASYKAALTGVLRWARDATGYDLVREISAGWMMEGHARARHNSCEGQSGRSTIGDRRCVTVITCLLIKQGRGSTAISYERIARFMLVRLVAVDAR
ncbi:hypothetical protein BD779DRAFT_1679717 [Infundibulicybe gibba]|nr:hypothetical protein BD779DRAFT_1679717 [Infundibulicybe gibba]